MMHTTVTTQQFQSSGVLFGSFLDASFTAEKTTEQTCGSEKLGVDTWLLVAVHRTTGSYEFASG